MLFNNYKPSKTLRPIELGTPSYLDMIGANVLDAPNDLAEFLTSFIPTDHNVNEQNVFQTLHNSIGLIKDNPTQSTAQKIVGTVSWLAGMGPGFGIASKAVKASTGLLGIAARTPLTKSIEGGLAYAVSDYPINAVENPNNSALQHAGKFAEDVVLGGATELGVRAAYPALRSWLNSGKSTLDSAIKSSVGTQEILAESVTPSSVSERVVSETTPYSAPTPTTLDELNEHGLNPTQSSKDSLSYSILHEAVRNTELSNPNELGNVVSERIIQELQNSPKLDELISTTQGDDKLFYQTIKNYKPNTNTDALETQLNQLGTQNFNKPQVSLEVTRDAFIKQFHVDNLDLTIPEHATLKKHIDNQELLDAFIKCKMGL